MSNFKIGDIVSVLDENLKGKVVKISAYKITIEDEDGFETEYPKNKIVACFDLDNLNIQLDKIIAEKEAPFENLQSKAKLEKLNIEIDLHIHELTDHSKYLTNFEMLCLQLDTAKNSLKKANPKKVNTITFIHGIGKGRLKKELEDFLKREQYIFYPGKYAEYGMGAITVELKQNK